MNSCERTLYPAYAHSRVGATLSSTLGASSTLPAAIHSHQMRTPTRKCASKASPHKGKKPNRVDEASPLKSSVSPQSINTPNTRANKGSISMGKSAKSAAPLAEEDNRSSSKSRGWFFSFVVMVCFHRV